MNAQHNEEWLSLAEATRFVPTSSGKPVSIPTLFRWTQAGIKGIKLPHARFGRRIAVRQCDIEEFSKRLAEAWNAEEPAAPPAPTPRTPRKAKTRTPEQRAKDIENAKRELRGHGMDV